MRDEWLKNGRVCPYCQILRSCPDEIGVAYNAVCKPCQKLRHRLNQRRRRADAKGTERHRQQNRAWRLRNPEAAREAQRRYRAKIMADPRRAEEWRENARIYHRLWRARKGRVRLVSEEEYRAGFGKPVKDGLQTLPAAPLAAFIDQLVRREEAGNPFAAAPLGTPGRRKPNDNAGRESVVCERLGVSPRNVFAWRTGEREFVQVHVADRVLTRSGVNWWDVWNEDTVPAETLTRVVRVFEPEEMAA